MTGTQGGPPPWLTGTWSPPTTTGRGLGVALRPRNLDTTVALAQTSILALGETLKQSSWLSRAASSPTEAEIIDAIVL